jgi:hypothetical protein
MSSLENHAHPAGSRRILAERPRAARRQRAEDGALTEIARDLLRDAREADRATARIRARGAAEVRPAARQAARAARPRRPVLARRGSTAVAPLAPA